MRPPFLESLGRRRLLVVTGKGGVGKSTVAAALGKLLAEAGRRVLVLEVDPRESIHQLFATHPSGGEILSAGPELWLQNLQPGTVLDRLVRERVRIAAVAQRVLDSPVYHHFTAGAPGLHEMAVLGHALQVVEGKVPGAPAVDLVVMDAPATGHGVALMVAPLLVSEAIRRGPVAALSSQVARLVRDPDRCGVVVVTAAEEMPVTEGLELAERLGRELGRGPDLMAVNGLYPALGAVFSEGPNAASSGEPGDDPLLELWRRRRRLNERELERLAAAWPGPRVELPLYALGRGPSLVAALAIDLGAQLQEDRPGVRRPEGRRPGARRSGDRRPDSGESVDGQAGGRPPGRGRPAARRPPAGNQGPS